MFDIHARMHQDRTVKHLALVLGAIVSAGACLPAAVSPSPTPVAASAPPRTSIPPSATATALRTPSPTPSPSAAVTTGAPGAACQRSTGGNAPLTGGALAEVRIGSQPGFARIVFDFAGGALPQYTIEQATSFVAPSGQTVAVQGNTHVGIRFNGAGGMGTYRGPTSFLPASTLIKEVKLVEDFEGVLVWGVGLERVSCPRTLVLGSPTRLVLDFPD